MRELYPIIEERRLRYLQHPFIRFLADPSQPPERRLSYAPFACHFVMTFSDINRSCLRRDDSSDPHQIMVNRHADEDARHWAWFLQDIAALGHNPTLDLVGALRFLWSDASRHTREMGYYTVAVTHEAEPKLRLAIVEALESMGNVWLEATLVAARQHPAADQLVYFGQHHLDRETGHAIGASQHSLDEVDLGPELRSRAEAIVHGLFDRMERFNSELLERVEAA